MGDDQDIKDVMAEESSRGRRQPKKLITVERSCESSVPPQSSATAIARRTSSWRLFASSGMKRGRRSLMRA
jgi:hypothetical protein